MVIEMSATKFGKYLKEQIAARRRSEGRVWSQNELGRRAGISGGHVSMIIHGQLQPDAVTLRKIANGLRVSVEEVFTAAGMLPLPEGELSGEVLELARAIDTLPESVRIHAITTTRSMLDGLYEAIGERVTDGYEVLDDREYLTAIIRQFRDNDPEEFARFLAALKGDDKTPGATGTEGGAGQESQ